MTQREKISMEKMIEIFNHIAMTEGFKMVVTEADPLKYFSTMRKFYSMVDRLIDHYCEEEEYEKCALLLEVKKKHGWKRPKVLENN